MVVNCNLARGKLLCLLFTNFPIQPCRVIRISPFANRLSYDAPPAVQRLRCLANYEALRFSSPILTLTESLVARMRKQSIMNGGKYVSIHLRFEEVGLIRYECILKMKADITN